MDLVPYLEVHQGDRIYRMHLPEQRAVGNIRPREMPARGWLRHFKQDFPRWNLYAADGQVIRDTNGSGWRIDIQSRSEQRGFWWALQGPGRPSPIYANATADFDINKFPTVVAAPVVAIALEKSWADGHTWHIRVETLEKRRRKRPRDGSVRLRGNGRIKDGVTEPTVVKESHYLDAQNKVLCWKVIEQVPKGRQIPQLWDSVSYLEKMWVGLKAMMAQLSKVEVLLNKVIKHDDVHGGLDVGAGSAGVVAGGLMVGGFFFPPLWIAGLAVGGASAVTGVTSSVCDHVNGSAFKKELEEVGEAIQAHSTEIQQALEAQMQQGDISKFTKRVQIDMHALSSLLASATLLTTTSVNPVRAVLFAMPEVAAAPKAADLVLKASNLASVPEALVQAANIPRTLSQISEASTAATLAGEAGAVAAVAEGGAAAAANVPKAAANVPKGVAVGGAVLKIGGGVLNIAAGGLQLGLGINRLVNGSPTAKAAQETIVEVKDYVQQTEEVFVGVCALVAEAYGIDSNLLAQLVDFSVA